MEDVTQINGNMLLVNKQFLRDKSVSIGEKVKECREYRNLTRDQLADRINEIEGDPDAKRSAKQISYIENGTRSISPEYAFLIAKALNVRLEYLLLQDNHKTVEDAVSASWGKVRDEYNALLQLLKFQGFEIKEVDSTDNGLAEHNHLLEWTGGKPLDDAIKITSPSGNTAFISQSTWIDFYSEICDYANYRTNRLIKKNGNWPQPKNKGDL